MTYSAVYCALISKRLKNPITKDDCYCERHHIIPKSEGGDDDPQNLVNLTAREHYIAHLLLAKIYKDFKMWSAVTYFNSELDKGRVFRYNSRLYELARIKRSKLMSGENHPFFGKHLSEETRRKISEATKGRVPWNKGKYHTEETKNKLRRPKTEEHRRKLSESLKGKKQSIETRTKRSESMRGRTSPMKGKHWTQESKMKLSNSTKGRTKSALTRERMSIASKNRKRDTDGRFIIECQET